MPIGSRLIDDGLVGALFWPDYCDMHSCRLETWDVFGLTPPEEYPPIKDRKTTVWSVVAVLFQSLVNVFYVPVNIHLIQFLYHIMFIVTDDHNHEHAQVRS